MSAFAHHTPRQIRRRAVCLLIEEVAPSAYALSDKKTNHRYIKYRHNLHFLQLCNCKTANQCSDYAAVDCKSSVVDVENFNGIFAVIIPLKEAKVKSCADNTRYYADKDTIYKLSGIYIVTR